MIIRRKPLSRRTVLKGMLGGAAISIALPSLEAFFGASGTAYANETSYPTRFGIFLGVMVCIPSIGFLKKRGPILI